MPELPEVETIARTLNKNLAGDYFEDYTFFYPKLLEKDSEFTLDSLLHRKLEKVFRRGKYLIFEFEDAYFWIVHLRMEGKFHLYDDPVEKSKHTHLIVRMSERQLHYLDVRKFSRMAVTQDLESYFKKKNLGPEPFDEAFNVDYLEKSLAHRSKAIKACLLDQEIVAGIGNIYADEILFECGLHPECPAQKLDREDYRCLQKTTQNVLSKAIEAGGTTIRSYTSALNVSGRFQLDLKAYGRYGQACYRCNEQMEKTKVAGRTSSFCPSCQKECR